MEAYTKQQGMWHDLDHEPTYSQTLELDLASVEPSIAGPKRPQDRIPLRVAPHAVSALMTGADHQQALFGLDKASALSFPASDPISITVNILPTNRARTAAAGKSTTGRRRRCRLNWPTAPAPKSTTGMW